MKMIRPPLVGLSGFARAGKDTLGQILVEDHGYVRASFADPLREFALALDPLVYVGLPDSIRLTDVVAMRGWESAKEIPEVRRLLQRLGTEAGRGVLGDDIWVNAAMQKLDENVDYVFTDTRFPNEGDSIKAMGGEVWRINRPGQQAINGHSSEMAMVGYDFDRVIENDGTIQELRDRVLGLNGGLLRRTSVGGGCDLCGKTGACVKCGQLVLPLDVIG